MTDYSPLIGKAVAALENNTRESRRALYEGARSALLRQSRNRNPPLTGAELTRERLDLELAIQRIEGEAARHSREAGGDGSSTGGQGGGDRASLPHSPPRMPAAATPPGAEPVQPLPPRADRDVIEAEVERGPSASRLDSPSGARRQPVSSTSRPAENSEAPSNVRAILSAAKGGRSPTASSRDRASLPSEPTRTAPDPTPDLEALPRPSTTSSAGIEDGSAPGLSSRAATTPVPGSRIQGAPSAAATLLEFDPVGTAPAEAGAAPAARSRVLAASAIDTGLRSGARDTHRDSAALLEFESPTEALIEAPVKPAARSVLWTIVSAVAASMAVAALFPLDMVVTGHGRVVSLQATDVVQPLETAIVRAMNVREGQAVRAGELLARLDSTFSGADASALSAQVDSYQAEVDRLGAEASGSPYQPQDADGPAAVQVAIYGQRQAQYRYEMESYNQKISGLEAQLSRSEHDVEAFGERLEIATELEAKRRELQRREVGSQIDLLAAEDQRIEMQRNLTDAKGAAERARRDLRQMMAERDGFEQQWKSQINQELALRRRTLSDAVESLRKATLRRELVDLRADRDAVVLSVAKVSVGSVLQSGEPLITLVPTDAPLEVETRIAAMDAGYVRPLQKVAIKFDTFPFVRYGMAEGTVRVISPDSFSGGQETQRGSVDTQAGRSGVFYKVRVSIDELKMQGVPGGFQLRPGMTVTADIKAGERTLLTYLFARVLPVGLEGMREP